MVRFELAMLFAASTQIFIAYKNGLAGALPLPRGEAGMEFTHLTMTDR